MDKNNIKASANAVIITVKEKIRINHSRDEKQSEYQDMVSSILDLYIEIVDDSNGISELGIEEFHFDDMIIKSPFAYSKLHSNDLLRLQYSIYNLARLWDIWVYAQRKLKFPNNQNFTMGEHLFFLSNLRERDNRTFYVKTFNSYLPPDKRLVAITIPINRLLLNYTPIIHEMGHVIGCRKRANRTKPLSEFLLLCILCEIYKECMSAYDDLTPNKPFVIPQNKKVEKMGFFEKKWWQYSDKVCKVLEIVYKDLFSLISADTDSNEREISYADKYVSDKCVQLVNQLDNEEYWKHILSNEYERSIYEAYIRSSNRDKMPFMTICDYVIDIFEEPVADCFMIKVCGLKLHNYLKMVFHEAWDTWDKTKRRKTGETFLEYMSSDVLRYRILSICYAMVKNNNTEISALNKRGSLWSHFTRHGRDINSARKMFREMYRIQKYTDNESFLQKLMNPQQILSEYIYSEVYQHKHFIEMENALQTQKSMKKEEYNMVKKLIYLRNEELQKTIDKMDKTDLESLCDTLNMATVNHIKEIRLLTSQEIY